MSKLTVKACIHIINPSGFNQNKGKTPLIAKKPFIQYYMYCTMKTVSVRKLAELTQRFSSETGFFFSVVEAVRLFAIRAAVKTSSLGFTDA